MADQQRKSDDAAAGEIEQPGEGNRHADKQYRDATKRFVDEGGVEPAAKEAQRSAENPQEREDLENAERIARGRAAEEDREVSQR